MRTIELIRAAAEDDSTNIQPHIPVPEHGMPGGLRPAEDPRHRLLRARHAGAAQGQKDLLRNENPR